MFKRRRERGEENLRREQEEKEARLRREQEELEHLRKWRFVVDVAQRDGRKTVLESILINALLEAGATVLDTDSRKEDDTPLMKEDVLWLACTGWFEQEPRGGYEIDSGRIPAFKVAVAHCDFRLLVKTERWARIAAAGHEQSQDPDAMAEAVVRHLVDAVNKLASPNLVS